MKQLLAATFTLLTTVQVCAGPTTDVVCAYAPSQSKAAAALSAAAGGSASAAALVAAATGTVAVAHSSGALILTGSGGYIAGTLGSAVVGPTIIAVGLVIGGAAVSVELLCAPRNHPAQVAKVKEAAAEVAHRTGGALGRARTAVPAQVASASLKVKKVAGGAIAYAFRRRKEE
jgi:hypothetical protein